MIRHPYYSIYINNGHIYLLPFGQAIVDRCRPLEVNEAMLPIWQELKTKKMGEQVLASLYSWFPTSSYETKEPMWNDYSHAVGILHNAGAVLTDGDYDERYGDRPTDLILSAADMVIQKCCEGYSIDYPTFSEYKSEIVPLNGVEIPIDRILELKGERLLAARWRVSLNWLYKGRLFLHSVSVLYHYRLWLFLAAAGGGKSTHAALWEEAGLGRVINGDLNVISLNTQDVAEYGDNPVVIGTPWCGTSATYDLNTYALGGIVFITKDKINHMEEMTESQKLLALAGRVVSPIWDDMMLLKVMDLAARVVEAVPMARLYCTTDMEACQICREYIDDLYSGNDSNTNRPMNGDI